MLVRDKSKFLKPTRERRNPAEALPDVQEVIAIISHAQMKPGEMLQIQILPEAAKKLNLKHPIRTITEYLRRYVQRIGREADYQIRKGNVGDVGIIDIRYFPADSAGKKASKKGDKN